MKKSELEAKIIEAAKEIPMEYGEYRLVTNLKKRIAYIMGYEVVTFRNGQWTTKGNNEDWKVFNKVVTGMAKRGIIRMSRNGNCYKVL